MLSLHRNKIPNHSRNFERPSRIKDRVKTRPIANNFTF